MNETEERKPTTTRRELLKRGTLLGLGAMAGAGALLRPERADADPGHAERGHVAGDGRGRTGDLQF